MIQVLNLIINGGDLNFLIPVLGWGIGVLAHFMALRGTLNSDDEIQKEMEKLKK